MIGQDKNFSGKDQWKIKERENREIAFKILENKSLAIARNMKDLIGYLDIQAKFPDYSVGNCVLVLAQKPNATLFRDIYTWKSHGFNVMKRERPIIILAPSKPVVSADGNVHTYINAKEVYDISSTNAPMPENKLELSADEVLDYLIISSPEELEIEPVNNIENSDKYAYYDSTNNKLYVCKEKDAIATIQDWVSELSKYYMSRENLEKQNLNAFKSTCIAYTFCKHFNIPFPKEAFEKIPNELTESSVEVRNELEDIKKNFSLIRDNLLSEVRLERDEPKKEQEQEQER